MCTDRLTATGRRAVADSRSCLGRRAGRQAGQALVETLVVALAMLPLAILVVLLGKYQSMQSATVAASRSLAFECAARPAACEDPDAPGGAADAVRRRHFDGQALWHDRAGRPLLEALSDVGVTISRQDFGAGVGTAVGQDSAAARLIDDLAGPSRFGLAARSGFYVGRIETAVARSHDGGGGFLGLRPFALSLHARTAVLADPWLASGPDGGATGVRSRVESGARLDGLRETGLLAGYQLTRWSIDLMAGVGLERSAGSLNPYRADPDAVPTDRTPGP